MKCGVGEEICVFDEFQFELQVGFVCIELVYCFGIVDLWDGCWNLVVYQCLQFGQNFFGDCDDVFGVDEVYFYIELGEFGLVVGVEVFVVVVVGDLVVVFYFCYYQQLFEQLWVLWQGVK